MNLLWLLSNAQAGNEGTFWLPPQASTLAADIDTTFYFIYWTSVVFFYHFDGRNDLSCACL
jgi:hypothetical protein